MAYKTPQKKITVPSGYIIVHEKWQGSPLSQELTRKCSGCCYEDLGVVDFLPSSYCPIIYVTEADMLCPSIYKSKLKQLIQEHPNSKGVIITCRNSLTLEAFADIQKQAVIHLSLTVMPIISHSELPELLSQMVKMENKSPVNLFKHKKSKGEMHCDRTQQVTLLSMIPGVREVKALSLLKAFGTITALSNASFQKLSSVVGNAAAYSIMDFFQSNERTKN